MEQRTAEQKVKEKWPDAVMHSYEANSHTVWNHAGHPDNWMPLSTRKQTPDAAWTDAAQRIQAEGAQHGK